MKRKIKNLVPYILIVLAIILLGIVISVIFQFTFRGQVIDLSDPEAPFEEKKYELVNETDMSSDEIVDFILAKRKEIMEFFNLIRYYNISDIEPLYTKEDDEKYMVLTDDFTDSLRFLTTSNLYSKLTRNFELLKVVNNVSYYKVLKSEFTSLHSNSAIAIFDYNEMEVHPLFASDDKINGVIRFLICDDKVYNFCRRDEEFSFALVKEDNNWLVDDLGFDY